MAISGQRGIPSPATPNPCDIVGSGSRERAQRRWRVGPAAFVRRPYGVFCRGRHLTVEIAFLLYDLGRGFTRATKVRPYSLPGRNTVAECKCEDRTERDQRAYGNHQRL